LVRLSSPCLVVLVGPSGAGKSHWAASSFGPGPIVSSDALRALVGTGEDDQRSGRDAFEVLDLIVERRLARGLLTVVDTLGLDAGRRASYVALARRFGIPCHAVFFDTSAEVCRTRNRLRTHPLPPKVMTAQLAARDRARSELEHEGFDGIHQAEPVSIVPITFLDAPESTARQRTAPLSLRFGLQVSSFAWNGGGPALTARLAEVASIAEAVGFSSIWLMDHVMQIPQVGRIWEDIPESWTTLAWLAAKTRSIRLGTLVTGITLRNLAHLAKIVATADVLSGGRVICGLGTAWWREEHQSYGWPFPALDDRYALLEDALQLLPLAWGPGTPSFTGATITVPSTICYPRPIQDHIPILVGGSGERRTLRLVAQYADACNLFGTPETVRRKLSILASHCSDAGRDLADVKVTHLSSALAAPTAREVDALVDRIGRHPADPGAVALRFGAGTIDDQIGRYRELLDAGVQTAIVSLPHVTEPGALEAFGEVIAAFRSSTVEPSRRW
jgi:F420-dependent oxidoreductase-like protein